MITGTDTIDTEAPPVAGTRWPLFDLAVAPGFNVRLGCGPVGGDQARMAAAVTTASNDVQRAMGEAWRASLDTAPEAEAWRTAVARLQQQRARIEPIRQDVARLRQGAEEAAAAGDDPVALQRLARARGDDLRDAESLVPALESAAERARAALADVVKDAARSAYGKACAELTRRAAAAKVALEQALAVHLAELVACERGRPALNDQQLASYAELPAQPPDR